ELRDVEIQTVPHQGRIKFDPLWYIGLLFLGVAWIVFLLRPDDKQAWLLALMLGTLTGTLANEPANLPFWLSLAVPMAAALGVLFFPVFLPFSLFSPYPPPLLRRWPRFKPCISLPYLLSVLPVVVILRLPGGVWVFRYHWFLYFTFAVNSIIVAYLGAG